jgi:hypothetical protein
LPADLVHSVYFTFVKLFRAISLIAIAREENNPRIGAKIIQEIPAAIAKPPKA